MQPQSPAALWGDIVPDDRSTTAGTQVSENPWIIVAVFLLFVIIAEQIRQNWASAQRAHHRRALLLAYRRRRQWRKADVPRLLKLGVGASALMRINRIMAGKGRGRGVVQGYLGLEETVATVTERLGLLFSPTTPPHRRVALLKQTPWWPHIVEALYRGEHAAAKEAGQKSPSVRAEQAVSSCLGVSAALVHKICEAVRKDRKRQNQPPEWEPSLRINEFEMWKREGGT